MAYFLLKTKNKSKQSELCSNLSVNYKKIFRRIRIGV